MIFGKSIVPAYAELDDLLLRICLKLQIAASQYQLAKERYEAISKWLSAEGSILAGFDLVIYPQGSIRIGTTVKPIFQIEFDLDLVLEFRALNPRLFPNPVNLLDLVEMRIKEHATYRKMYERKNRCIRICYANDFHLDILPACPDRDAGGTCLLVPDREAQAWKPSNPKGYARWFESKAVPGVVKMTRDIEPIPAQEDVGEKFPLQLVTQLLKRDRDIRYQRNCQKAPISIVLTTLAASHYRGEESVSLSLLAILKNIVACLPANDRLRVYNPSNLKEDLSERWEKDREAYRLFVEGITAFHKDWEQLLTQRGEGVTKSLELLFGEDLAKAVVREKTLEMELQRKREGLAITSSGIIVNATATGSIPIRSNTFYGA